MACIAAACHRSNAVRDGTTGRVRVPVVFDHLGERRATVSYQLHGPAHAAPVVVLGGISAGRRLAPTPDAPGKGWWPGVVGSGSVLDPSRHRLVGIDYLGGPTPDGDLLRPVTSHDQARALAALLDRLEMPRASLVGASYGGMVALAFAELFPERLSKLVVLCAAHRTHPMATAWRSVQREAVRLGARAGRVADGVALARALAMTTYRSADEFEERFSSRPLPSVATEQGEPAGRSTARPSRGDEHANRPDAGPSCDAGRPGRARPRFPVENYLHARGADFAGRFDPERFLALSESIDLHWTEPSSLPAEALLVSVASDALVPPWLVDDLVEQSGGEAGHVVLESPFGHDAFLKEVEHVSAFVRSGLALDKAQTTR